MTKRERLRQWRKLAVYLAGLFLAFHYALVVYVNSSILKQFLSARNLGLLYVIASAAGIIFFINVPKLLRRIGDFRASLIFIFLELIAIFGISSTQNPKLLIIFFLMHQSVIPLIFFTLDIFLEHEQGRESGTGGNRGVFLTFQNVAWISAPILAGFIGKNFGLPKVYLVSSLFLIPLVINLVLAFRQYKDHYPPKIRLRDTWRFLKKQMDVGRVITCNILLQFFYAIMVIYMPLLLFESIGFGWSSIGAILSIMLLPFLILEFPLGYLADKKIGEVEIMYTAFLVIFVATFIISFIYTPIFILWALMLFATRVGASSLEISSESYFFKHVKGRDANIISIFRMTRPLAYLLAPLFAILMLSLTNYHGLFTALSIFMLLGLFVVPRKDTK